jgi:hypothetical protein
MRSIARPATRRGGSHRHSLKSTPWLYVSRRRGSTGLPFRRLWSRQRQAVCHRVRRRPGRHRPGRLSAVQFQFRRDEYDRDLPILHALK